MTKQMTKEEIKAAPKMPFEEMLKEIDTLKFAQLKGVSEKQIQYGEQCRAKFIAEMRETIQQWGKSAKSTQFQVMSAAFAAGAHKRLASFQSAKWWIENKHHTSLPMLHEVWQGKWSK